MLRLYHKQNRRVFDYIGYYFSINVDLMNKPLYTVLGFLFFAIGILSIIMSMVGLQFSFLSFMYNHGVMTVVIQLILLLGGMILLYVARTSDLEE